MERLKRISACAAVLVVFGISNAAALVRVDEEEVLFRFAGVPAAKVYLIGDFNGWNPTIDQLGPSEGGFEIRLFLLPGAYRYRFIVDGVSRPDPDNPFIDGEGNSRFILVERDGALEILLSDEFEAKGERPKEAAAMSGKVRAFVTEDGATLFGEGRVRSAVGERSSADLGVGMTAERLGDDAPRAASVLLRGSATYRFDRGTLTAFTRSGRVGLGDSLALFTPVGPFRYPVGLFCRGFSFSGELPLRLDLSAFYASRIEGYRSGLEASSSASGLFRNRDLTDADLIGGRLGTTVGRVTARYLYREDRRPKEGVWQLPGVEGALFRGFERARLQGFSISLAGDAGVTLGGEFVLGGTRLSALEESRTDDALFRPTALERRWERGRRFNIGVARRGETSDARVAFSQTTIEGERSMRDGRPDGERTACAGALERRIGRLSIALRGGAESYSASNTGSVFWLGRTNFWLDGDELTCDRIPFLSARQLCEWSALVAVKDDSLAGVPRGTGLRIAIRERRELGGAGTLFREVALSKGLRLLPRATFLVDMRGVSYRYAGIERDFVDAFVSLHTTIGRSVWCSLGCGVDPYAFDRWLFEFSDHGRADYLIDRGVFHVLNERGESGGARALLDAEEALAEDFMITFEAGYAF